MVSLYVLAILCCHTIDWDIFLRYWCLSQIYIIIIIIIIIIMYLSSLFVFVDFIKLSLYRLLYVILWAPCCISVHRTCIFIRWILDSKYVLLLLLL